MGLESVGESGPQVVVLFLDARQPTRLFAARQARFRLLRERDEVLEMPAASLLALAGRS